MLRNCTETQLAFIKDAYAYSLASPRPFDKETEKHWPAARRLGSHRASMPATTGRTVASGPVSSDRVPPAPPPKYMKKHTSYLCTCKYIHTHVATDAAAALYAFARAWHWAALHPSEELKLQFRSPRGKRKCGLIEVGLLWTAPHLRHLATEGFGFDVSIAGRLELFCSALRPGQCL